MSEITRALMARAGEDIAIQVIQVHAVDASGNKPEPRAIDRDQFLAWRAQTVSRNFANRRWSEAE